MINTRSFFVLVALGAALMLVGCGGSGRTGASGSVTYKGTPLKTGTISFIAEGARTPTGGAPIVDGKYNVPADPGLPPGKYKVTVSAQQGGGEVSGPPGESVQQPKELIPAKYNTKSELSAEIKPGSPNSFNFDLK